MSDAPVTVLITGATGFVGRHLIAELEDQTNWELIGLGRSLSPVGGRARMLACDLMDAELVLRVIERYRPGFIVHLAAQSYVPQAFANPAATLTNNVVGQLNLLEGCRSARLSPIILIVGSAEEYGAIGNTEISIRESQTFRPTNPYAVSKISQDMLGLQYQLSYGMHIVRVRPFNHFGPGQSERFVLSGFARQIAQAELGLVEPVVLTGNLNARRDFLDVRDVVRAYRLALERQIVPDAYNIARGEAFRIGDLLSHLVALSETAIETRVDPARMRPSDTPYLVGDASKFQAATGWRPRISIDQTLSDTLSYWRRSLAPTSM